jgi:hypothetical protein
VAIGTPSGTYGWNPALAEYVIEAFERIGIFAPALEDRHIISCRRSMNLILSDYPNRGINLWTVDQVSIPLVPGQATYQLPPNTVDLLDTYRRQYGASSSLSLGNALTVLVTENFDPVLTPQGEPIIIGPMSGVFSTTAGDQTVTMNWPNHNQAEGSGIFFQCPVTAGPMTIRSAVVTSVVDPNTLTFLAPADATQTRQGTGGTPLFVTKTGSRIVTVVLAGHGLGVGANFTVDIATMVGGLTLAGGYTITSLPSAVALGPAYDFTIEAALPANANAVAFENQGQIPVLFQTPGQQSTDIILTPIGRDQYASLPNKMQPGTPTTFWFDRLLHPTVTVWPVPPAGSRYGFIAYRTRYLQDANPTSGETAELQKRFIFTFTAELTSLLAEKFAPAKFAEKTEAFKPTWQRASDEDREKVTLTIRPTFGVF